MLRNIFHMQPIKKGKKKRNIFHRQYIIMTILEVCFEPAYIYPDLFKLQKNFIEIKNCAVQMFYLHVIQNKFDLNLYFYLQRLACLCLLSSMQYKFFVDGEWRHDENQPFISCTYGIVNTVLLARESDYIPPTISPAVPSLTNMDVDNEAFQQLVGASYTSISDIIISLLHHLHFISCASL